MESKRRESYGILTLTLLLILGAVVHQSHGAPVDMSKFPHIMDPSEFATIQQSSDPLGALQNFGTKIQNGRPAFTPQYHNQKPPPDINSKHKQSWIIGTQTDVANSLINGPKLQNQGRMDDNYHESTAKFQMLHVTTMGKGANAKIKTVELEEACKFCVGMDSSAVHHLERPYEGGDGTKGNTNPPPKKDLLFSNGGIGAWQQGAAPNPGATAGTGQGLTGGVGTSGGTAQGLTRGVSTLSSTRPGLSGGLGTLSSTRQGQTKVGTLSGTGLGLSGGLSSKRGPVQGQIGGQASSSGTKQRNPTGISTNPSGVFLGNARTSNVNTPQGSKKAPVRTPGSLQSKLPTRSNPHHSNPINRAGSSQSNSGVNGKPQKRKYSGNNQGSRKKPSG